VPTTLEFLVFSTPDSQRSRVTKQVPIGNLKSVDPGKTSAFCFRMSPYPALVSSSPRLLVSSSPLLLFFSSPLLLVSSSLSLVSCFSKYFCFEDAVDSCCFSIPLTQGNTLNLETKTNLERDKYVLLFIIVLYYFFKNSYF
jgi:hypothetical protein